ncbi:MAG: hypothetical protein ACYSSN_09835 [Planctomycetota bacterium]|jgi:hypothetical protein
MTKNYVFKAIQVDDHARTRNQAEIISILQEIHPLTCHIFRQFLGKGIANWFGGAERAISGCGPYQIIRNRLV